jgi:polysaccharide pyruvyl transferase WcaK-like protein
MRKLKKIVWFANEVFMKVVRFLGLREPLRQESRLRMGENYQRLFRSWGSLPPESEKSLQILLTAGMGYANVGDEAQMGASIGRWRRLLPSASICVLSPNPEYTQSTLEVDSDWAPRVVWFSSNTFGSYFQGGWHFKIWFWWVWFRQTFSARCLCAGIPINLCDGAEFSLLNRIRNADVLHISGGGFLTGMTRSRLWENGLLMRLCQIVGTPYVLTGQTLGVFKSKTDRWIAKMALEKADYIYLRDRGISEAELKAIGIEGKHVKSTFDDALFFESLDDEATMSLLRKNGIDPTKPYAVANFHYWGQDANARERSTKRFAELADVLASRYGLQVLYVPMTPSDEAPEDAAIACMNEPAQRLDYHFDYREARAVYRMAQMVFTMKHHPIIFGYGEGIPVLSVALDDYYYHKNKGAMDNCDQGHYCLTAERFYSADALSIIQEFFDSYESNQATVKAWLESARSSEAEVQELFLAVRAASREGLDN